MASARRTGSNEQIVTYGGVTRTYDSGELSVFEAATDTDHVTDTESDILECYNDAIHDDSINMNGGTNDASFFRIVRPAAGEKNDGTSETGVRFLTTGVAHIFSISDDFDSIQDLNIAHNMNSTSSRNLISFNDPALSADAIGVISFDSANSGTGTSGGINLLDDGQIAIDCLIENTDGPWSIQLGAGSGETTRAYNCTIVNSAIGVNVTGAGTHIAKNCLATGNTTDFDTGFATGAGESENNASEDASAPGSNSNASISTTNLYVDAGSNDYHIQVIATTDVRDAGIDLSADGFRAFDNDVDLDVFNVWDIGFDENNPAGAAAASLLNPNYLLSGRFPHLRM